MHSRRKVSLLTLGILSLGSAGALPGLVLAQRLPAAPTAACRASDSTAAVRIASRFHEILSTGDTTGINALLASDLRVLEGGSVENRQEYLSHHLSADIEFTKAVKEKRTSFLYRCEGNLVWLISTSTSTGNFGGRDIDSTGAESMLLSWTRQGWKIRAIHWSSAKRQPR
jgi:hypothetical protein